MESPTISTRNGAAAVGSSGWAAPWSGRRAVVPPFGAVVEPGLDPCGDVTARGPDVTSPTVPPGRRFERPVAETMCESCSPRLSAATGPVTSRLMVRRVPTGETCALCCRVGAKSRNHTAKAAAASARTRVHGARARPSSGASSSGCGCDRNSDWDSQSAWCGGVRASVIRSGSR